MLQKQKKSEWLRPISVIRFNFDGLMFIWPTYEVDNCLFMDTSDLYKIHEVYRYLQIFMCGLHTESIMLLVYLAAMNISFTISIGVEDVKHSKTVKNIWFIRQHRVIPACWVNRAFCDRQAVARYDSTEMQPRSYESCMRFR